MASLNLSGSGVLNLSGDGLFKCGLGSANKRPDTTTALSGSTLSYSGNDLVVSGITTTTSTEDAVVEGSDYNGTYTKLNVFGNIADVDGNGFPGQSEDGYWIGRENAINQSGGIGLWNDLSNFQVFRKEVANTFTLFETTGSGDNTTKDQPGYLFLTITRTGGGNPGDWIAFLSYVDGSTFTSSNYAQVIDTAIDYSRTRIASGSQTVYV